MYQWMKRHLEFFLAMLPMLFVLILIAVQLYRINGNSQEANKHSSENNRILIERNARFDAIERKIAEKCK